MRKHTELIGEARRIAALVPTSDASETFIGLVDALLSAEVRLAAISAVGAVAKDKALGGTPRDELIVMQLASKLFLAFDGYVSIGMRTNEQAADMVIGAGWRSPAEVAEMVRAAAEEAWDHGIDSAGGCLRWEGGRWVGSEANPYRRPTAV